MPPEPEITNPPAAVRAEVTKLAKAIDKVVPPKKADRNLLIGTWNLRAFGGLTKRWESRPEDSPKRNLRDVLLIAEVVSRFDVVALQETRGDLRALRNLLRALGSDWAFLLTDVTKGPAGNNERLAFLYDTRRVKPSGLACELVVWIAEAPQISEAALDRQFARTPYACSFATLGAKPTTFILVTLHVDWANKAAERIPELKAIAQWLAEWAEDEEEWKHNLIALGDFNIEGDDLFKAFTSTGLSPPAGLANVPRTIFDDPGADHHYDQIAWFDNLTKKVPVLTLACTGANNFNFVPALRGSQTLNTLSWHISDHYPLFVEFGLPQ
ncbi:MAG: endonuclease/exonuclease/phosphatase family protein [Actinomycetota bacterium]